MALQKKGREREVETINAFESKDNIWSQRDAMYAYDTARHDTTGHSAILENTSLHTVPIPKQN